MIIEIYQIVLYCSSNLIYLIAESQFISVLSGQLRSTIGLSEQEITELADYFRVQDGRIFYTQLCEVMHDSGN